MTTTLHPNSSVVHEDADQASSTFDPDMAHQERQFGLIHARLGEITRNTLDHDNDAPLLPSGLTITNVPAVQMAPIVQKHRRFAAADLLKRISVAPMELPYYDQSTQFWIGAEFTLDQFARWWSVQNLGTQPFNAVGYHHTYKPTPHTWAGLPSLTAIYDYYYNEYGWRPWGMGPHIFIYAGNGSYKPGTPRIYVGVHPRYNGAGISYRNNRWLHIEHIHNGDAQPFPDVLKQISGQVLAIVCAPQRTAPRQIPLQFILKGHDNPKQPLGIMYHRDVNPAEPPKSCPGSKVTHANLDADVLAYAREYLGENRSAFIDQSVPPTMRINQQYQIAITMKNTGLAAWNRAELYRLGAQSPRDNQRWRIDNRVRLPQDSVAPNTTVQFTFEISAPAIPGRYEFQWQMVQDGVEWFGDRTPLLLIDVEA